MLLPNPKKLIVWASTALAGSAALQGSAAAQAPGVAQSCMPTVRGQADAPSVDGYTFTYGNQILYGGIFDKNPKGIDVNVDLQRNGESVGEMQGWVIPPCNPPTLLIDGSDSLGNDKACLINMSCMPQASTTQPLQPTAVPTQPGCEQGQSHGAGYAALAAGITAVSTILGVLGGYMAGKRSSGNPSQDSFSSRELYQGGGAPRSPSVSEQGGFSLASFSDQYPPGTGTGTRIQPYRDEHAERSASPNVTITYPNPVCESRNVNNQSHAVKHYERNARAFVPYSGGR